VAQNMDDVLSIKYDWITRVLYFAMHSKNQTLKIWSLPLDNPLLVSVYAGTAVLSNDSDIVMTIAPFAGYANNLDISYCIIVLLCIDNCTG